MKRISTMFLALSLIISAFAMPMESTKNNAQNQLSSVRTNELQNHVLQAQRIKPLTPIQVQQAPATDVIEWKGQIYEMTYYDEGGDWCIYVDLDGTDKTLQLDFYTGFKSTFAGTYTTTDMVLEYTLLIDETGRPELDFTEVELTVTAPEGIMGAIRAEAMMTGRDGSKHHVIAERVALPDPEQEVTITADNMRIEQSVNSEGYFISTIFASNEEYEIEMLLNVTGDNKYTPEHVEYLRVKSKTGEKEYTKYLMADMTISEKWHNLSGVLYVEDGLTHFTFDLDILKPEKPSKTVEVVYLTNTEAINAGELCQFVGHETVFPEVSEHHLYTAIAINSPLQAGEFTSDHYNPNFTEMVFYDFSKDTPIPVRPILGFHTVNAKVEKQEHKYVCQAELWGIDNVLYKVTINAYSTVEGALEYDEITSDVNLVLDKKPQLTFDDAYNWVYCDFVRPTDITAILFCVTEKDPDIMIPAGTYYINHSEKPNTVMASTGVDVEGNVYYSYYGILDEEGYLYRTWFMVSGTVLVENQDGALHIVVDAINSCYVPIHIEYTENKTAIENTSSDTSVAYKTIGADGQIYIHRNGHTYTTVGAMLK